MKYLVEKDGERKIFDKQIDAASYIRVSQAQFSLNLARGHYKGYKIAAVNQDIPVATTKAKLIGMLEDLDARVYNLERRLEALENDAR